MSGSEGTTSESTLTGHPTPWEASPPVRFAGVVLLLLSTQAHAATRAECRFACAAALFDCHTVEHPARCRRTVRLLCRATNAAICHEFANVPTQPSGMTTTTIVPPPPLDVSGVSLGPHPRGASSFYGAFPPHDDRPDLGFDVGFFIADHVVLRFPTRRVGPVLGVAWLGVAGSRGTLHVCPAPLTVEQVRPGGTMLIVALTGTAALPLGKLSENPLHPGCFLALNPAGNMVGLVFPLRKSGLDWRLPMEVRGLPFSGGPVLLAQTRLPTTTTSTTTSSTSSSSTTSTSTSSTSTTSTSTSSSSSTSTSSSSTSSSSTSTTSTSSSTTTSTVDPSLSLAGPLPPGASVAFGSFPVQLGGIGYYVADQVDVPRVGAPKWSLGPVLGFSQRMPQNLTGPLSICAADLSPITVHQLRPDGSELVVVLDPAQQDWHGTGKYVDVGGGCATASNPAGNVVGWVIGLEGTGLEFWRSMTVEGMPFAAGPLVL